jgi:hypothetical protein
MNSRAGSCTNRCATGQPWEPLAPTTLALRRKNASAKTVAKLQRAFSSLPAHRQRLIKRQYQRLVQVYGDTAALGTHNSGRLRRAALGILERMRPNITPGRYKQLKTELKKKTPLEKAERLAVAGSYALILRDSGRLFNSLGPALRGGGEQLLAVTPGQVVVGSGVKYGDYHTSPKPRKISKRTGKPKLPRRQFLPDDLNPMPATWWTAATTALTRGMVTPSFWATYLS